MLIFLSVQANSCFRQWQTDKESVARDARTAGRDQKIAELQKEISRIEGENSQLRAEITEEKTLRAAQEQIIEQRGGEIAAQQQRIEDARKEFEREEAIADQPISNHARCQRLRAIYIELRIRGAERINCDEITR